MCQKCIMRGRADRHSGLLQGYIACAKKACVVQARIVSHIGSVSVSISWLIMDLNFSFAAVENRRPKRVEEDDRSSIV
jgi:hypothetical protein